MAAFHTKIEDLQDALTRLVKFKRPYLEVRISRNGDWLEAKIVAVANEKAIGNFGFFMKPDLESLRRAVCDYLTFKLVIYPAKETAILETIAKFNSEKT